MIKFVLGIIFLATATTATSQNSVYEFKNDYRPKYGNTLTIDKFSELQVNSDVVVLDVRLEEDFKKDPNLIPGAEYKNPELLPQWISELDKTKEVVVYCVAGKWVSQKIAFLLDQNGINVRSLEGGFEAWKAQQGKE